MKTAVIGAGASGIMAAICAARAGASVSLYEHKDNPAAKLLITGNGKCNYTNARIDKACFHSSTDEDGRLERMLREFDADKCIGFFESIGIKSRERKGGIYPYSDTAESVRTALLLEIKKLRINLITGCGPLSLSDDRKINGDGFDRIIIACGSLVSPGTGSDGSGYEILKKLKVELTPLYPALSPLVVKEDLSMLKGIRCDASLLLLDEKGEIKERSSGELQPYDRGLSGICAMDISGNACRMLGAGKRAFAEVDFFPCMNDPEFKSEIARRREMFPERNLSEMLTGLFPKKLINYLVHPVDTRKKEYMDDLCNNVKHHRYELSDEMIKDFSRAQTVAGGVPLYSADDRCMLKDHEGIYVIGELLDADGICGGYNLHFAWTTGYIAGNA